MNSLKGFRKLRSTAKKAKGGADPISFGARRTDCKISRGILLNLTPSLDRGPQWTTSVTRS